MGREHKISWRDNGKIDPGFDEMVKTFLSFVGQLRKAPNEGLHQMPLEVNESVTTESVQECCPSLIGSELKVLNKYLERVFFVSEDRLVNDTKGYEQDLLELVDLIPDKSRKYYADKIDALSRGDLLKKADHLEGVKKEKQLKANLRTVRSLICSLGVRYFFSTLHEIKEQNKGLLADPLAAHQFLTNLYGFYAQIAFLGTIGTLIQKGDDTSLLKAVRIDKTALYTKQLKTRITKAQITGDTRFLNRLSRAIKEGPLQQIATYHETFLVLNFFWLMGLDSLKYEELYYFLKDDCGLIPPAYPRNFEDFVRKKIKPLYR